LNQAARNANDAISLSQTAEGALGAISGNLQRMRELAVQAANGTNSASDRAAIQNEVLQLSQEINRVATTTQFNGQNLLDGTITGTAGQFQVGANANQTINVAVASAQGKDLGDNSVVKTASAAISVAVAAAVNGTAAGNLILDGNGATATLAVLVNASAKTIAGLVNTKTDTTGISATATTTATITGVAAGTASFTLQGSNTTAVNISATISDTNVLADLAKAINQQSANTGITATSDAAGSLVLTAAAGEDIKLVPGATGTAIGATFTGSSGAGVVLTASTAVITGGAVEFSSKGGFAVTTADSTLLGTTGVAGSTKSTVSAIDVSTTAGATGALKVIDSALAQISDQRAALGAVQNRFESTVNNLQTSAENLSASRSRIQDADFAQETANLSRSQILQQAGTAMVAQANQLPQGVLALLR